MKRGVAVTKMHGARNDFIVVDTRADSLGDPVAFAISACDRRTGIGADGLLLVAAAPSGVAMRVINSDGSEAEMCGNGVRCLARYVDERTPSDRLLVETSAGRIETEIVERGDVYSVRVNMGRPAIENTEAGATDDVRVSVGNPHIVRFVRSLDDVDVYSFGASMQHDPRFPGGVNAHVAVAGAESDTLHMRHFERGAGLTMACGTGAVAAACAAIGRGLVKSPVRVFVPGGELRVEWDGRGDAFMTGPAAHVFDTVL